MKTFLAVCLGGAVGTGGRYLVQLAAVRWLPAVLPFGTLAVNVAGSLLLGIVTEAALRGAVSAPVRATVAIGVLGGFTTYSSFNQELLLGVGRGAWVWSAGYCLLTIAGCLAAGAAGGWLARMILGA